MAWRMFSFIFFLGNCAVSDDIINYAEKDFNSIQN